MTAPPSLPRRALLACAVPLVVLAALIAWRVATLSYPANAPELAAEIRSVLADRLTAAVLIGAVLGISGVLLRSATRNPLADAEITGVNAGAAFGAVAATSLLGARGGAALLPGALIGATCAVTLTLVFSLRGANRAGSALAIQKLVLLGIAISALFSALTSITLVLDEAQLATVLSWLSGKLGGVRMADLIPTLLAALLIVPAVIIGARRLDALAADDAVTSAVGANPGAVRLFAVASAVGLVAPAVAAAGPIGFLGLMSAALAHRVVGNRHRYLLVVAACTGAAVLLAADTVAQALWAPAETPVGIVTALAGVPVLLWGIGHLRPRRVSA